MQKISPKFERWCWLLGMSAVLLVLYAQLAQSFGELKQITPESFGFGWMGAASAPYSDALAPWTHGTAAYYLRDHAIGYLYRPTIGLFFGSLIALTHNIASVPVVACATLLAGLLALFFCDAGRRFEWTVFGGVLAAGYPELIRHTNPEGVMVDLWALSFTLSGVGLVLLGVSARPKGAAALLAGFLLLGVSACVRGPQIGAALLLWFFLLLKKEARPGWLTLALGALAVAAPLVIDASIRKRDHVQDNMSVTLYSVYTGPSHVWTPESHARFLQEKPDQAAVREKYLRFVFSGEGMRVLWERAAEQGSTMGRIMGTAGVLGPLLALGIYACWVRRQNWTRWFWLKAGVVVAAVALAIWASPGLQLSAVIFLASWVLVLGWRRTNPMAVVFMLGFAGSFFVHTLLGGTGGLRVACTYLFLWFLAVAAMLLPERAAAVPATARTRWFALGSMAIVLCGYVGLDFFRTEKRAEIRRQMQDPQTALKLGDSPRLDRSLYIRADTIPFFTRRDAAPLGAVRRFSEIKAPAGFANESFVQPCEVTWKE